MDESFFFEGDFVQSVLSLSVPVTDRTLQSASGIIVVPRISSIHTTTTTTTITTGRGKKRMQEDDQDADADAQRQLEGLRVLYGACCNFFLGTQAAEEAAAAAATAADTAGAGAGAVGFPANSLPLAAAMMLDRFALLLHPDQPSIITPQMLARKAMLLHQGCESPSLRREIKEELLGRRMLAREQQAALEEYGETFEISRRPHIYDIPFPPRASQLFPQFRGQQQDQDQDQEVAAAAHTADNDDGCTPSLPFSQSHVYTASKAFYERNHERAWISAVPFGVTTNAKLADAYARVLLAYLQDLAEEGDAGSGGDSSPAEEDGDGPRTAHIVELAAGHGLFGFLLAKRLRELSSASSAPSPWRIRLVMTDFNRRLLESRRAAPWLRPFGTDGSVDFAVLDASCQEQEEGQGLELLSGRVLRPGSLRGPLIVLGNYALDSLPSDIFFQLPRGRRRSSNGSKPDSDEEEQEEEDEDGGESVVRELVADPTTRRFHLAAPCPARLASYRHAGLLRAMLSRGREGLHVVNAGFLAALAWLRGLLHPSNRREFFIINEY